MRKVIYTRWIPAAETASGKAELSEERHGYFHQWGATYEEFESGPGNFTMAIVEDESTNKVYLIHPERVQFLEGPL